MINILDVAEKLGLDQNKSKKRKRVNKGSQKGKNEWSSVKNRTVFEEPATESIL